MSDGIKGWKAAGKQVDYPTISGKSKND